MPFGLHLILFANKLTCKFYSILLTFTFSLSFSFSHSCDAVEVLATSFTLLVLSSLCVISSLLLVIGVCVVSLAFSRPYKHRFRDTYTVMRYRMSFEFPQNTENTLSTREDLHRMWWNWDELKLRCRDRISPWCCKSRRTLTCIPADVMVLNPQGNPFCVILSNPWSRSW